MFAKTLIFCTLILGTAMASPDEYCCCGKSLTTSPSFVKLGKSVYFVQTYFRANFFTAAQYCRTIGMHLVSLESRAESQALERYINTLGLDIGENIWSSGTDLARPNEWKWLSTGQRLTYTNFVYKPPQPFSPDSRNCLELLRDKLHRVGLPWNNAVCTAERYFACELEEPPRCQSCINE